MQDQPTNQHPSRSSHSIASSAKNDQELHALIAREFPQEDGLYYLNHAAVSPWPASAAEAVIAFAKENVVSGARHYPAWLAREKRLRERLARITGAASVAEIALVKNTSEALSIVAFGLDWRSGDEVIISNQEFPSNRVVWKALEKAYGVVVKEVEINGEKSPEEALLTALTTRTRLLSISSVQYGSGLMVDLSALAHQLKKKGVLFCVDAIQSLGATNFHVEADQIDFLMADGHKWMMGPEGVAVLYVRTCHLETLKLFQYGWHMLQDRGNYEVKTMLPASDATRFECGSPNMLGITALEQSLTVLESAGLDTVSRLVSININHLHNLIKTDSRYEIITNMDAERVLGILTFKPVGYNGAQMQGMVAQLMKQGVVCAYRGGGIRFSPHFYTSQNTIENAVNLLNKLT